MLGMPTPLGHLRSNYASTMHSSVVDVQGKDAGAMACRPGHEIALVSA
jgi:hypothetical protein